MTPAGNGQVVRIKLERPQLASIAEEGTFWTVTIGDIALEPTRPLGLIRNIDRHARASAIVPFEEPRTLHRLTDPDAGDTLLVVTALGPARGFLKAQDFVEFRALPSTHGVVIQPLADDVAVELAADKVVVGRPSGLTLSAASADRPQGRRVSARVVFDAQPGASTARPRSASARPSCSTPPPQAPEGQAHRRRGSSSRASISRATCTPKPRACSTSRSSDQRPTAEDTSGAGACARSPTS